MDIGKRIISLREQKGWTTNRLANMSGVSQSFLRAVELGQKGISVESLSAVCWALGVSLDDVFCPVPGERLGGGTAAFQGTAAFPSAAAGATGLSEQRLLTAENAQQLRRIGHAEVPGQAGLFE